MGELSNAQCAAIAERIENLLMFDENDAIQYIVTMPIKQVLQMLVWSLGHRPEVVPFLHQCILKTYTPIIIQTTDGKYISLMDYQNPKFLLGVEGTCHITIYNDEFIECDCSRLVYKLSSSHTIQDLIIDCVEFVDLSVDNIKVLDGLGEQLIECSDISEELKSNVF